MRVDAIAQESGGGLVKLRRGESGAQSLFGVEGRSAFGAGLQVPFETGSAGGVELAIEIGVEMGGSKITGHGCSPLYAGEWIRIRAIAYGRGPGPT